MKTAQKVTVNELATQIQENIDNIQGARDICACLSDPERLYIAYVTVKVKPADEPTLCIDAYPKAYVSPQYPKCTLDTMSGEDAEGIIRMLQDNIEWRTEEQTRLLKLFSEVTSNV